MPPGGRRQLAGRRLARRAGANTLRAGDAAIRRFVVTRDRHDPLVTLTFRKHGYWPGGAREVVEVRPIKARREGQPMLLAFTKGDTGQGTILIGVQNGEPLMRPLSPMQRDSMVRTERDPEWGVPQPGRSEMLLFPRDGRALDTDTGELLWFDVPGGVTGDYAPAMLVSVSPRRAARRLSRQEAEHIASARRHARRRRGRRAGLAARYLSTVAETVVGCRFRAGGRRHQGAPGPHGFEPHPARAGTWPGLASNFNGNKARMAGK